MSEYTRQVLRVVVAKICQTIGWHSINSTPLEIMVDLLRRYFIELTRLTHSYATQFGHTQPNLDELALAFRDMHVNIADLEEYIQYVESAPPLEIPLYPVPKESHLNFLKPGSNEVVTRPVHVHEHLPPMLPDIEESDTSSIAVKKEEGPKSPNVEFGSVVFKRPADVLNDTPSKRPRLLIEEEGRPTREISSVMMTTSGFLSPAREGKLPEARTPVNPLDQLAVTCAQNASPIASVPTRFDRKCVKAIKDMKKIEKRKDRTSKELFKPDEPVVNKKGPAKEPKTKALNKNSASILPLADSMDKPVINPLARPAARAAAAKKPKLTQAKADKHVPLPSASIVLEKIPSVPEEKMVEGKLSSEPDRNKLNILKKITKVKEDKVEKMEKSKPKEQERVAEILSRSRESSPDLIIDESDNKNWEQNIKIPFNDPFVKTETEQRKPNKASTPDISNKLYDIVKNSPRSEKDFAYDDYMSPPGTPLTPKTPEMPAQSPPVKAEKRKKKDKAKLKKTQASKPALAIPVKAETIDELDRPKTPDDPINLVKSEQGIGAAPPVFPFLTNFSGGPGLIPPLNPLFSRLPMGLIKPGFGQPPNIPGMSVLSPFSPPAHEAATPLILNAEQPKPQLEIIPIKEKHKKEKKEKIKKKNKKDKIKNKSEKRKIKEEKREKDKVKKIKKEKKKDKGREHEGSVPKLTLKISSPRPPTPDAQIARKIMIKPVVKKEEPAQPSTSVEHVENRQPSPELARISALVTRPPKLKTSKESHSNKEEMASQLPTAAKVNGCVGRPRLGGLNKSGAGTAGALPHDEKPPAGKPHKVSLPAPPLIPQMEENKVWICPACGRQDDGSPMIGCDDCDAWYHWVCVGIQVPPDDNEDWYCRICIVKKQEMLQVDKKKKRKKKEKKLAD